MWQISSKSIACVIGKVTFLQAYWPSLRTKSRDTYIRCVCVGSLRLLFLFYFATLIPFFVCTPILPCESVPFDALFLLEGFLFSYSPTHDLPVPHIGSPRAIISPIYFSL